jgi:hypothetical protein
MVQLRKGQVRQEAAKAMIAAGADGGLRLKLEKATAAAEAATAAVAAAEAALAAEGAPKAIAVPAASEPTDAGPSAVADEEGAAAATLAMRDAAAAALKRELAAGRSKEEAKEIARAEGKAAWKLATKEAKGKRATASTATSVGPPAEAAMTLAPPPDSKTPPAVAALPAALAALAVQPAPSAGAATSGSGVRVGAFSSQPSLSAAEVLQRAREQESEMYERLERLRHESGTLKKRTHVRGGDGRM